MLTFDLHGGRSKCIRAARWRYSRCPGVPATTFYLKLHDTTRSFTVIDPLTMPSLPPFTSFSVTFNNPVVDSVLAAYHVSGFTQITPGADLLYLRQYYKVTCDSAAVHLGSLLTTSFPGYFSKYEEIPETIPLSAAPHYPVDYTLSGSFNVGFLDYVGAPYAWGVNRGSPDVHIGITDTYFDIAHPELMNKIVMLRNNVLPPAFQDHGTQVAGFAACETNEAVNTYPSMGYDCRLNLSGSWGREEVLNMSIVDGTRVINNSWFNTSTGNYDSVKKYYLDERILYDQVYENGTVAVFGAGNGRPSLERNSSNFLVPSSLDHNISVSSVGWGDGRPNVNVGDIHERLPGFPDSLCHQHNLRVDILAPGYDLGGLTYDDNNPNRIYEHFDPGVSGLSGTSYAAPIVAGTIGLMYSQTPCLSPYQVEWVLKQTAENIYDRPDNAKYYDGVSRFTSSLGAGKLDAGLALQTLDTSDIEKRHDVCNDPALQTFIIEGVDINTICAPGSASNGAKPKLKPVLRNGVPPYTYYWAAIDSQAYGSAQGENHSTLDDYNIAEPTIETAWGDKVAYYYLTVRDGSEIQKVASRMVRIQLKDTATYDLALRDSYMDMLDEANMQYQRNAKDWNIWKSPDLWVRNAQDDSLEHQDPVYSSTVPNYIYTRVRNVGCAASPAPSPPFHFNSAKLYLYWTKASTGERWPGDWDGSTFLPTTSTPALRPAGGGVDTMILPVLQPGEEVVFSSEWYPEDPAAWVPIRQSENPEICLLARITHFGLYDGMTYPETVNTTTNVRNNNNSVTRNLIVKRTGRDRTSNYSTVLVANAHSTAKTFTIQLVPDKLIQKHLSGDYSAVGTVTLELEPAVMSILDALSNSFEGSLDVDYTASTVTYDGSSLIQFEHLELEAEEKIPMGISFNLKKDLDAYPAMPFEFHLRQFEETIIPGGGSGGPGSPSRDSILLELYGNVSFLVQVEEDVEQTRPAALEETAAVIQLSTLTIYPNPAHSSLYVQSKAGTITYDKVQVVDIYGRGVKEISDFCLEGKAQEIPLQDMAPGTYFISFYAQGKAVERLRFVKL